MLVYHTCSGRCGSDDDLFVDEEYVVGWKERVLQMTAEEFYRLGNEFRKKGDWQQALNNYMEAIALDPESPAVEAKKMLEDILDFYHKDAYNP